MAVSYEPVKAVGTLSGVGFPVMRRIVEHETQTFLAGQPLILEGGGVKAAADPTDAAIIGFAAEAGHNLTAAHTAEDGHSEGAPPNQPLGKTVALGAWVKDGRCAVYLGVPDTVFRAFLTAGEVYTEAIKGNQYRMAKDATTGHYYIEIAHGSAAEAAHCVKILDVDPSSPNSIAGGAAVYFTVPALSYLGT